MVGERRNMILNAKQLKADGPVYAAKFLEEEEVIIANGGGRGNSGVKNKLSLLDLSKNAIGNKCLAVLTSEEDVPMAIDIHPKGGVLIATVNSKPELLQQDINTNIRIFEIPEEKDHLVADVPISGTRNRDADEYDRVVKFSPDGSYVAIGSTTSEVTLLSWPSKEVVELPELPFKKSEEIYDISFNSSSEMVAIASDKQVVVFTIPSEKKTETIQIIESPKYKKSAECSFRAAKFGHGEFENLLYTVTNTPKQKGPARLSFISTWDTKTWTCLKSRRISKRVTTSFNISDDGKWVAAAGADLSLKILDAHRLRTAYEINNVHHFPSATVQFSPKGKEGRCKWLVSASPDNQVVAVRVDSLTPAAYSSQLILILLAVIMVVLAILFGKRVN